DRPYCPRDPAQGTSSDPHQTCDFYRVSESLPPKFNQPETWRRGYRYTDNPLYRTSNQIYGSRPPTVHEMPVSKLIYVLGGGHGVGSLSC
uniref:Uncharacterized protein n=1 Tax=Xenopus tropicalis TaxID=8364 RepID=A0A803JBK7_XENTR